MSCPWKYCRWILRSAHAIDPASGARIDTPQYPIDAVRPMARYPSGGVEKTRTKIFRSEISPGKTCGFGNILSEKPERQNVVLICADKHESCTNEIRCAFCTSDLLPCGCSALHASSPSRWNPEQCWPAWKMLAVQES